MSAVMRHFQTGCDVGLPREFAEVLRDRGSKNSPPHRNLDSYSFYVNDDGPDRDYESLLSSGLGYPHSYDSAIYSDTRSLPSNSQCHQEENFFASQSRENDGKDLSLSCSPTYRNQTPESNVLRHSSPHNRFGTGSKSIEETSESNSLLDDMETFNINDKASDASQGTSVSNSSPESADTVIRRSYVTNEHGTSKASRSIAAAAHILQREVDQWDDDGNSIVQVVKEMTSQMFEMAQHVRGRGHLKSKEDFINTAKAIAANAKMVAKFASIIAEHCKDKVCKDNLLHYNESVDTISTQLRIVASVKAATPNDETADTTLTANAENLMKKVIGTLKAAESASVTGPRDLKLLEESQTSDDLNNTILTFNWKRKLNLQRTIETITAPTNDLGLRMLSGMKQRSFRDFVTSS